MTTDTNVAVTTEAPTALKSTDTSSRVTLELPKTEPVKAPKVEPVEAEVDPVVPPEGVKDDAQDAASPRQGNEKRLPRWMKERLERVREVTAAETREKLLREFQEKSPQPPQAVQPEAPKLKTIEDFDFDQQRYTDYLVDTKLEARERQTRADAESRDRAKAAETFKSRIDAFEERAGDGAWEDIVSSPLNTDKAYKALTDLFMGDEHDLDIAHHLASDLKEADRIKALPRVQQLREISKLAEKFEDGSQSEEVATPSIPAPLPKKTTTAPPPPKTVSGSGKPSVDINDPGLTTEQRIAAWRKAKRG